jgi:hypothetical protein
MNYTQLIIRGREDTGKIFVFFPHKGIILETECNDVKTVCDLLELMKNKSIKEIEKVCQKEKISGETLDIVKAIYKDLKDMNVGFNKK